MIARLVAMFLCALLASCSGPAAAATAPDAPAPQANAPAPPQAMAPPPPLDIRTPPRLAMPHSHNPFDAYAPARCRSRTSRTRRGWISSFATASSTSRCRTRSRWRWRTISIWRSRATTCPSPIPTSCAPRPAARSAASTPVWCRARRAAASAASEPALPGRAPAVPRAARVVRAQARPAWCNRRWASVPSCRPMIRSLPEPEASSTSRSRWPTCRFTVCRLCSRTPDRQI